MSSYASSTLDLLVRASPNTSTTDQLELSRWAAHRFSVTQAVAARRAAESASPAQPARRSLWSRVRGHVLRPRPA